MNSLLLLNLWPSKSYWYESVFDEGENLRTRRSIETQRTCNICIGGGRGVLMTNRPAWFPKEYSNGDFSDGHPSRSIPQSGLTSGNRREQEPMSGTMQLTCRAYVAAFLQTGLFFV